MLENEKPFLESADKLEFVNNILTEYNIPLHQEPSNLQLVKYQSSPILDALDTVRQFASVYEGLYVIASNLLQKNDTNWSGKIDNLNVKLSI